MPSIATNDVDLYCTHGDLVDEMGSERKLRKMLPAEPNDPEDPTRTLREQSLRDVLKALSRRTPPITESMLSTPEELKDAVVFATLMRLYRNAITVEGDVHSLLYNDFKKRFESEISSLRVTVDSGAVVDVQSIPVFRR